MAAELGPRGARTLREELALAAQHYHLSAQGQRFGRVFAYTLAAQLAATGGRITGWAGLWSLLAGSAEAAFRQWRKTIGVQAAQRVADEHQEASASAAPPAG